MAKRIAVFLFTLLIILPTLLSCVDLDIYIPPSGISPSVDNYVPSYSEDYSLLPIIEYKNIEFRLDKMLCCDDSDSDGYITSSLPKSFDDLEDDIRADNDAMIIIGTVMENPKQTTEAYAQHYAADVICPVRIDKIVYQSDNNGFAEGDVIEVDLSNKIHIVEKQAESNVDSGVSETNNESVNNEQLYDNYRLYVSRNCGIAMISGAKYIMYLNGTNSNYEKYRRYTIPESGAFEITDYCESFTPADNKAASLFSNKSLAGMAIRNYNLQKECGIIYDPAKYQISSSLSSSDDVKTVGIKIGNTIVEGWEYVYDGYDLSSGIIPDGCPVIVCEYGDKIELIFDEILADGNYENKEIGTESFFNMKGDEICSFNNTNTDEFFAGAYWLLITAVAENQSITPDMSIYGYLFCIIMD